jgi:hypothetical protein
MTTITELASGFSLNSLRQTGEYAVPAPADAPGGVNHAFVSVRSHNLAGTRRVAQTLYDAETGAGHYRSFAGTGWTSWAAMGGGGGEVAADHGGDGVLRLTDGEPGGASGEEGDVSLDFNDGTVYQKVSGSWAALGNFLYSTDDAFWTLVTKSATVTIQSDDSLNADAELLFPMEANTTYRFRARIFYQTTANADFKYDYSGPASPTAVWLRRQVMAANASAYSGIGTYLNLTPGAIAVLGGAGVGLIELDGLIENGANAGNFQFSWAQNTSIAEDTSVKKGSYIEYKTIT